MSVPMIHIEDGAARSAAGYLTTHPRMPHVSFRDTPQTGWTVEGEHVRTPDGRYIGSPNKDRILFCYTTPCRYTRWRQQESVLEWCGDTFNADDHTIVIARYEEDLRWALPYHDMVVVYNKGSPNTLPPFKNVYHVPNVGRESETYLRHICGSPLVAGAPHAARITFLQGAPHEHNETIQAALEHPEKLAPVQPLGIRFNTTIPPTQILDAHTVRTSFGLSYTVVPIDASGAIAGFFDEGIEKTLRAACDTFFPEDADVPILEGFRRRYQLPPLPDTIPFTYSALVSVERAAIERLPRDVWRRLWNASRAGDFATGFLFERLWLWLFGYSATLIVR